MDNRKVVDPNEIVDQTHKKIHEFLMGLNLPTIIDAIALNYTLNNALRNLGVNKKYLQAIHDVVIEGLTEAGEAVDSQEFLHSLDKDKLPRA